MQFHYLWIDEYRNFRRQAFNLSGCYRFALSEDATTLRVSRNERFVKGFWQYPNLQSATAIVGENGSGKSNLLDFIRFTFPQGERLPDPKEKRFIAAVEKEGERIVFYNHLPSGSLKVAPSDGAPEWKAVRVEQGIRPSSEFGDFFDHVSFIFYSNEFSPGVRYAEESATDGEPVHGLHDVSTRYFSLHDAVGLTNDPSTTTNRIVSHGMMEVRRNLDFLSQDGAEARMPFSLPSFLGIKPMRFTEDRVFESEKEELPKIQSVIQGDGKQAFLNRIALAMLLNYARDTRQNGILRPFQEGSWHQRHQAVDLVREAFQHAGSSYGPAPALRCQLLDLITAEIPDDDFDKTGEYLRFGTRSGVTDRLQRLLRLYTQSVMITPYLETFWSHRLSSGEQSLLTLYSRFWSITEGRTPRNKCVRDPAIVLVDEGDIYFHPAWQRELVGRLLEFLAKGAFPEFSLQVILTSNSPFCLSDFPKSNVVFVRRDRTTHKSVVLPPDNNMRETFAANIHDLLGDSFFMEYSLMGAFARERVREVISWLQGDTPPTGNETAWLDAETASIVIDDIGEPLLRQRLRELYEAKARRLQDPDLLDRVIQRRAHELRVLEAHRQGLTKENRTRHD